MSERDVLHHWPGSELPPDQVEEVRRLEATGDAGIDAEATPPAPADAWQHARRGPVTGAELETMRRFFRPVKEPVSIRLDADVLHRFKERSGGRAWQTEINRALRADIERNG